ncbi:hypothetical protein GC167_02570 [bacterium]|nr:hypothetical protein [bacterium]
MIDRFRSQGSAAGGVLAFVLGLAWVAGFYSEVLLAPNDYLFSGTGDGIKNYYTYVYSIRHLRGFEAFDGMNYPFGERSLYTDNHPVLAWLLQGLQSMFPAVATHSVGLLNLLILLSIPLNASVLQRLYQGLGLKTWLSVLAALGTAVLAPQIHRWTGHLSLAHAWYVPVALLLLMRWEHRGQPVLGVLGLALWIGLGLLIHPYLGMMAALLALSYALVRWAGSAFGKRFGEGAASAALSVASLLPLMVFFMALSITETHPHRTDRPWGIKSHMAEPETVFLPTHRPLRELGRMLDRDMDQVWEGWAYIGLCAVLFSLWMLGRWGIQQVRTLRKSKRQRFEAHAFALPDPFVRVLLGASVLVLLWAMAIPLRWLHDLWVDALGPIRQFRALGRFAWVFYYAVHIALFHALVGVPGSLQGRIRRGLTVLVPVLMITESLEYHWVQRRELVRSANVFDAQHRAESVNDLLAQVPPDFHQALLPMPFFHIGSENFERIGGEAVHRWAFVVSDALGMPMMGGSGSRTALSEAKAQVQWMSEPVYPRLAQGLIDDGRPLLMVCSGEPLSAQEQYYYNRSRPIGSAEGLELRSIDIGVFRAPDWADSLRTRFGEFAGAGAVAGHWYASDSAGFFVHRGFDERHHPGARSGTGAYEGTRRELHQLAEFKASQFPEGVPVEASVWIFNGGPKNGQDQLFGRLFWIESPPDFQERWLDPAFDPRQAQTIDGDWSRVSLALVPERRDAVYRLMFKGPDDARGTVLLDEVLIRPLSIDLGRLEPGTGALWFNNHRLGR